MKGPLTRILLRYVSDALVTSGVLAPQLGARLSSDPDVARVAEFTVAGVLIVATEGY